MVTDGGASAFGYEKEENDCSVVATALALEIHYEEALTKLSAAGRSRNNGFYIVDFLEHCTFKGYSHETIIFKKGKRPTEQEFAKKHKKGNWIVYTEGHVVAVIDGVIFDNRPKPTKNKVQYAWRFTKTA